jgi:predicted dehydrogenase
MQRHRILVIGVGSIGERHVRCCQATGRADVSIVETRSALADQISQRYGVAVHRDLEAAVADRPTAAIIATPAPCHVAQAAALIEAGIHVLIEKPLSISLLGVDRLQALAAERQAVVGVAYVYRAFSVLATLRETLHSGRFGQPQHLIAVTGQHFPTHRPAYREIYYANPDAGGGAVQDALTHLVNAGEWLVGPIDRLVADAAHLVLPGVEVEDTVNVLTRQGSVLGCYSLNQYQAPDELTITIVCTEGTLRCEIHNNCWMWMKQSGDPWHKMPLGPLHRDAAFIAQAHSFLDAVERKTPLLCPLNEGIQTLRVNLAILASVKERMWRNVASM